MPNQEITTSPLTHRAAALRIFGQGWSFALSRVFFIGNNLIIALIINGHDKKLLPVTPLITSGQLLLTSTSLAVGYSIAIKTGGEMGAGRFRNVGTVFQSALLQSGILSIFVMGLSACMGHIYIGLGQKASYSHQAQLFFNTALIGAIPCIALNAMQQILIGMGKPKMVLLSTMLNTAVLAGLGYTLTNGVLFPELGISGMGVAYTATSFLNFILLLLYFKFNHNFEAMAFYSKRIFTDIKNDLAFLFRIGLPIGLQVLSELISVILVTVYSGLLDKLSENQITDQYLGITVVTSFAVSQTVGTLVARSIGSQKVNDAKVIGSTGICISLGMGVAVAIIFSCLGQYLARAFTDQTHLIDAVIPLFIINGVGSIFDNVRNVTTGVLRGHHKVFWPGIGNAVCMTVIAMPLAYLIGIVGGLGMEGVYGVRAGAMLLGAVTMLMMYYSHEKNNNHQLTAKADDGAAQTSRAISETSPLLTDDGNTSCQEEDDENKINNNAFSKA